MEYENAAKQDSAIGGGAVGIAPAPTGISEGNKKIILLLLEYAENKPWTPPVPVFNDMFEMALPMAGWNKLEPPAFCSATVFQ